MSSLWIQENVEAALLDGLMEAQGKEGGEGGTGRGREREREREREKVGVSSSGENRGEWDLFLVEAISSTFIDCLFASLPNLMNRKSNFSISLGRFFWGRKVEDAWNEEWKNMRK